MNGAAVQNAVVTLTASHIGLADGIGAVVQEAWLITGQRAVRFSVTPVDGDKAYVTLVIHAEQPRAEAFAKTLRTRGFSTILGQP